MLWFFDTPPPVQNKLLYALACLFVSCCCLFFFLNFFVIVRKFHKFFFILKQIQIIRVMLLLIIQIFGHIYRLCVTVWFVCIVLWVPTSLAKAISDRFVSYPYRGKSYTKKKKTTLIGQTKEKTDLNSKPKVFFQQNN